MIKFQLLAFILICRGRALGVRSSASLFIFWLMHTLCSLVIYRSSIIRTLYSVSLAYHSLRMQNILAVAFFPHSRRVDRVTGLVSLGRQPVDVPDHIGPAVADLLGRPCPSHLPRWESSQTSEFSRLFFSCLQSMIFFITPWCPQNLCPEDSCSVLSKIFFWWLNPLIMKGYRQPLTGEDQWSLVPRRQCDALSRRFNKHWQKELLESKR